VLLVEDNPADAAYVEAVLSASTVADFHLEVAGTLQAGLDLLTTHRFDVVLSDLTLPDGEGLGTFTALRDRVPGVPVVVITGATDEDLGRRAVAAGAEDFLTKGQLDGLRLAQLLLFAVERTHARLLVDPLTGLATRDVFLDHLRLGLARSATAGGRVAVLTIGLAGVPEGASAAAVVAVCATRMLGALRPTDVLARIGPTEFAAAVEGLIRPANAERAAHRILGSLAGEIPVASGTPVRVVAGVGLTWGHAGDDPNKLLLASEQALAELQRGDGQGVHWADQQHP
jgi:PleD family two-component response regulator